MENRKKKKNKKKLKGESTKLEIVNDNVKNEPVMKVEVSVQG